jgi:hypothetical protein
LSFVGRQVKYTRKYSNYTFFDHVVMVDARPGQTATVTIGGAGRKVIGRIVPPEGQTIDFAKTFTPASLSMQGPSFRPPPGFESLPQTQRAKAYTQWLFSDEGKTSQLAAMSTYFVPINADGTFTVPDVPPGEYTLQMRAHKLLEAPPWGQGEFIGQVSGPVEVEDEPGQANQPVDAGTFELQPPP